MRLLCAQGVRCLVLAAATPLRTLALRAGRVGVGVGVCVCAWALSVVDCDASTIK